MDAGRTGKHTFGAGVTKTHLVCKCRLDWRKIQKELERE
jgi:hypothetical protein